MCNIECLEEKKGHITDRSYLEERIRMHIRYLVHCLIFYVCLFLTFIHAFARVIMLEDMNNFIDMNSLRIKDM